MINSEEGVLYAEVAALSNDGGLRLLQLSDGTNTNRVSLYYDTAINRIYSNVVVNGVANPLSSSVDILNFIKVAVTWKENHFSLWINGLKASEDVSGSTFSSNTLNDLSLSLNGLYPFYGKNKALAVYKTALTDASLRSLTYPAAVATTFDLNFNTIAEDFTFTRGSEATFVNAQGLIQSTASNDAPRLDYSTGAEAFLLEPQSTNLIPYSELFSDAYWTKSGASVVSGFTSPDGTANAFKFVEGTNNGEHIIYKISIGFTSGATLSYSFFAKKGERNVIQTYNYVGGGFQNGADFDLSTGVVSNQFGGLGSMTELDNGWWRCNFTSLALVGQSATNVAIRTLDNSSSNSYQGDGTSGVYIYGAMLEQQSYPTSYIPTSGASATRNQELCNNATPVINSEEGTLYAEISALANDGTNRAISISDGSTANVVRFYYSTTDNRIVGNIKSGGSTVFTYNNVLTDETNFIKIALSYKANDFKMYVNGLEVSIDTIGNAPTGLTELSFDNGAGNDNFFGNTKGLKYYPKALADVQLQDLTTL